MAVTLSAQLIRGTMDQIVFSVLICNVARDFMLLVVLVIMTRAARHVFLHWASLIGLGRDVITFVNPDSLTPITVCVSNALSCLNVLLECFR